MIQRKKSVRYSLVFAVASICEVVTFKMFFLVEMDCLWYTFSGKAILRAISSNGNIKWWFTNK